MLNGLYKVEFETPRRKNVGVIYAKDGQLRGGSGTFAYLGTYEQSGNAISGVVTSKRHTDDPDTQPIFDFSGARITFHGVRRTASLRSKEPPTKRRAWPSRHCSVI
jgi:hypothetical protein